VVLTIAVGSADGEVLSLVSAISARLAATNAHVRLKVVDAGTSLGASQMLSSNKVELAIVRGDTGNLSDARSALLLLSEHPILAQAAAPSTDADALIPIHPGAAAYYSGTEQGFLDKYSDKLYYGSLLGGSLISVIPAAWRFAGSGGAPQNMLETLYELGSEIRHANSEAELEKIEGEFDSILKAEFAGSGSGGDEADGSNMAALGLAAQRLRYLMGLRRSQIHAAATASN
jgi:hypothetical protein